MNVVILGASFAGLSCAKKLHELDKEITITVIDKQTVVPFAPNALNWYYHGEIQHLKEAQLEDCHALSESNLQFLLGKEVTCLNPERQTIILEDTRDVLHYDYLILAMGSSPASYVIEGAVQTRVVAFKDYYSSQRAKEVLDTADHITIIGAGPIGIEASETYTRLGKQVTLVEAGEYVDYKNFDCDMVNALQNKMYQEGVTLKLGQRVTTITEVGESEMLRISTNKETWTSDAVLLCVNFRPNTTWFSEKIYCRTDGTVRVNSQLRSINHSRIYAVGDLVRVPFMEEKRLRYLPLISHAILTGEYVAYNLAGIDYPLSPTLNSLGSYQFGIYRGRIGFTEEDLILEDYDIDTFIYRNNQLGLSRQDWIAIKLIVESETGVILGMQCISNLNGRILLDMLAPAMQTNMTDKQFLGQAFFYSPSDENLSHELQKACQYAYEQRRKRCKLVP